jgi:phospholipase/carboxylesterase
MHSYKVLHKGSPLSKAEKAIILLHGRGATANDIIRLADEFCDDRFYIVAPQAENKTWYPYSFLAPEYQNEPWLDSAINIGNQLIAEISESIPIQNIYMMGFSQGACLTLEITSRNAMRFAGIIAFTGGLIGDTIKEEKYKGNFAGTKVFIGNSDIDPHVPLIRSVESKNIMNTLGANVTLKVYPNMTHIVSREEINEVRQLLFDTE